MFFSSLYSIHMQMLRSFSQHGWIVAWAVSLVLLAQQGHGTVLFLETFLLILLLGILLFVVPRNFAVLTVAIAEVFGQAIAVPVLWPAAVISDLHTRFSDVPVRFVDLQLPPPQLR